MRVGSRLIVVYGPNWLGLNHGSKRKLMQIFARYWRVRLQSWANETGKFTSCQTVDGRHTIVSRKAIPQSPVILAVTRVALTLISRVLKALKRNGASGQLL